MFRLFAPLFLSILAMMPWGGLYAQCTTPTAQAGEMIFSTTANAIQLCRGTDWVNMNMPSPTAPNTGCTNPTGVRGEIIFNSTSRVHQVCNGSQWADMACAAEATTGSGCTDPVGVSGTLTRITQGSITALIGCSGTRWQQLGVLCGPAVCPTAKAVYTAGTTTITVPPACTGMIVKAWGAGGGGSPFGPSQSGGAGGFAQATIPVTAGESLDVLVGSGGTGSTTGQNGPFAGGTGLGNGGAGSGSHGGYTNYRGSGGGAGSGIRRAGSPLIVAGGGGGAGSGSGTGGAGGGANGQNTQSCSYWGAGGSQSAAGASGSGAGGTAASGGNGASPGEVSGIGLGGGGGGYFGGGAGGGAWGVEYCGGAGGSGFVTGTSTTNTAGSGPTAPNTGDVDYAAGVAVGGSGCSNNCTAATGGSGRVVIQWVSQ